MKAIENFLFLLFLSHQMQFVLGDIIISITSLLNILILPHSTLSSWHSMTPTKYYLHLQVLPCFLNEDMMLQELQDLDIDETDDDDDMEDTFDQSFTDFEDP